MKQKNNKKKQLQITGQMSTVKYFASSASAGQKLRQQGFSLIEVLFALVALSAGIVTIIFLMTTNIKTAVLAKNQVIAAGLAQEGIELVRNIKDNDAAFFVLTNFPSNEGYRIDYSSSEEELRDSLFSSNNEKKLFIDDANGLYGHASAGTTATKFYRKIKITEIAGTGFAVTSLVGWGTTYRTFVGNDCNAANSCLATTSVMPVN